VVDPRGPHAVADQIPCKEEGTTTTPFNMVMLIDLDRFHLVMDVIDRVPSLGSRAASLRQEMMDARLAMDVLAFTGGVGEHAPQIRAGAAARLGWLGLTLDQEANEMARPDADITGAHSTARCVVVTAREDLQIAREARGAVG
jgi:hypothetical protein